ncbi:preprotein translocase subunit SecG [Hydrogenophaga sp. PAMC20947]|uniref:preprotein translocase subunit SecG n=1 Tax=Hydrogenophaga sp. PAMC20947 TaxID=2565558 RepID=UPI00109DD843|nr:preprotein translocase subunit SecG [Hydrogenophaga sp. PAMC20947]QCB46209.1 preprotein translocase subunit SecG [Hydrogenophaga sp. PAMC20947]
MHALLNILQVVQILAAVFMVGLILMQHGKGADAGAAFGGGAGSASLFGASGGANFLSRTTGVLAGLFLATTLGLAYFGNLRPTAATGSVLEGVVVPVAPLTPAEQIPGSAEAPAAAPVAADAVPSVPADVPAAGEAQIPSK